MSIGNIKVQEITLVGRDYEFIERKGSGHPDTLADELAEELSLVYSKYTLDHFSAILHHNFDKVGLLGGASYVNFNQGHLVKPIRVLINGRASTRFSNEEIPVKEMLIETSKRYLKRKFPMINVDKDIEIHYNLSTQSSPGKTDIEAKKEGTRKYWFEPRSLKDLKELDFLNSNDTSLGTGFAPRSALEEGTLKLERWISGDEFKKDKPWLGSDIKIMSTRVGNSVKVTMCIPQISKHVKDINEYKQNLTLMRSIILNFLNQQLPQYSIELSINTRDNYELGELYLTAIGSSIESGDEGLVGRGNRPNGVIAVTKPYSIEGACGKNPVYHVGKVYNVAAQNIAEEISNKVNVYVEVFLVSQSGRSLIDPWVTVVGVNKKITPEEREEMEKIVKQNLQEIPKITKELLDNSIKLC